MLQSSAPHSPEAWGHPGNQTGTTCSFYIELSAVTALSEVVALGGERMSGLDIKG